MGLFGGIKQRWNDGSLMSGLQAAGAIAHGDYGTAAQIQALQRRSQELEKAKAYLAKVGQTTAVPKGTAGGGAYRGWSGGVTDFPRAEDAVPSWQNFGEDGWASFERWLRDRNTMIGGR